MFWRNFVARSVFVVTATAALHSAWAETLPDSSDPGLSLDRCLQIALLHNYDLKQAKEQIRRQYEVVVEARAEYLPRLGLNGDFTYTDEERIPSFENGSSFGAERNWTAEIRVDQSLFAGGKALANHRRAKFREEAAKLELEAVMNNVLLEVMRKYYAVLLANAQVDVERQNVTLFEEQLRSERNRFEAGTVSEFNVLRAEVDLANSRTPFIRAKNRTKIAWEELRRVLGVGDIGATGAALPTKVSGELTYAPFRLELEDALLRAEKNRAELKRASVLIDAEEQSVKFEEAEYFPAMGIFGSYGADQSPFSNNIEDELHGWKAGALLTWNLFDSFKTTSRVNQAQIGASQARITLAQTRQDIGLEVRRTHSSLIEADELVQVSSKVVRQADESLRLAQARYDTGAATYLETLDRQVALTQARTNQVQALHDYNVVAVTMRHAIGELSPQHRLDSD